MKKYLFIFLLFFLFLSSLSSFAEKEDLKELPTIIVRGKDRSYLEVMRAKRTYYMVPRGEKEKASVEYTVKLPTKKEFVVHFPPLSISFPRPSGVIAKKKEVPLRIFPSPLLSYLPPEKIRPLFSERLVQPLMRKKFVVKKELIHPPLQVAFLEEKVSPLLAFPKIFPIKYPEEKVEVVKRPPEREIKTKSLPSPTLAKIYISEEEFLLKTPIGKEKGVFFIQRFLETKKLMIEPPLYAKLPEKKEAQFFFPKLSLKPPQLAPLSPHKEVPVQFQLAFPLYAERTYIEYTPVGVEERKIPFEREFILREVKGKEKFPEISFKAPHISKIYHPEKIQTTEYPYLHFSFGLSEDRSFEYKLDYGREKEKARYLLNLEREYSSQWVIHQSGFLGKEEDILQGNINWGALGTNESYINLSGNQKKLELPNAGEESDTRLSLNIGQLGAFNLWDWNIKGKNFVRREKNTGDGDWDILNYGVFLALHSKKIPFVLEGEVEWQDIESRDGALGKSDYQVFLGGKSAHPFSLGKNLSLDAELGIKGVGEERTQAVGSLKLDWYMKKHWRLVVEGKRKFYLPDTSELYLSRDYSQINPELDPVEMTGFGLNINYENNPWVKASLSGFFENGEDVVWLYSDGLMPSVSPQIIRLSRQVWRIKSSWHVLPVVSVELSHAWVNTENEQEKSKVVPYEPENFGELALKLETDTWYLRVGQEWLGKRYSTFEKQSLLPSSTRTKLKIAYKRKNWEAFFEAESNNDYFLSEDLKFPNNKFILGIKFKLF